MSVLKLKSLMDDVIFSFKFANTHLNMGMPSLFKQHSVRHGADIDLIRQTDVDASRLSQFRRSIETNVIKSDNPDRTGTDDYKQMVDIIIKRGGLLEHYAGTRDASDWKELKDLPSQVKSLDVGGLLDNKGRKALFSVGTTAYKAALTEIQASMGEISDAANDAVVEEIVNQLNVTVDVEAFGEKITVDEFKAYIDEVKK